MFENGKPDPDEVVCVMCGEVQGFAGWDVSCESCGAVEWEETDERDNG